jgi:(p)ppGpp synthase/HD superfamily hydrolase
MSGSDARPAGAISPRLERALRWAAACHAGQVRKGSDVPYFQHVAAVAMILDRAGFEEDVVIAGLLHDVVEDTEATEEDVERRFGPMVSGIVRVCSEVKLDTHGRKRPWIDRRRDHLASLGTADTATRAVMLADKLHNLISIEVDLEAGHPIWDRFNADRTQVPWYYGATIEACSSDDPRARSLAIACHEALERISRLSGPLPSRP